MPGIGYSFQPGSDVSLSHKSDRPSGQVAGGPPSAVRTLSLRIPKQGLAGAFAPQSLLQSQGMAGLPMGGLSPQILQLLMEAFGGSQGSGGSAPFGGGSGSPQQTTQMFGPPRIVPGDEPFGGDAPAQPPSPPSSPPQPPTFSYPAYPGPPLPFFQPTVPYL